MNKITQFSPFPSEELYLFKIVSQKHKVDAAESQLSDNEEEVHDAPAEGREEQRPSDGKASRETTI